MYKFLWLCLFLVGSAGTTCAQQRQNMNNKQSNHKILVVYFSATGTTARVAERLADITNGTLCAILPVDPYTSADLDWRDSRSRSSAEMNDSASRPAIEIEKENISDYDVILIGYPIWWDLAPRVVNTFVERYDLTGKTIIPFATSGSSGIANSVAMLKRSYPALNWEEGRLLNRADERTVRNWIDKLGF